MMTKSQHNKTPRLVECDDYRLLIRTAATEKRESIRQLALQAKIHPSYMSRVMADNARLSGDQAFRLATCLQLSGDERELLLLLVAREAAGDQSYYTHVTAKIEAMRKEQTRLAAMLKRPNRDQAATEHDQIAYYQEVITAKIHMYLTMPRYRARPELLRESLGISQSRLTQQLKKLERAGLITRDNNNRIVSVKDFLHLDAAHPASIQNHINWRLDAIRKITDSADVAGDYHFSAVFSANEKTRQAIQQAFKKFVVEVEATVSQSAGQEDNIYQLGFDLYR